VRNNTHIFYIFSIFYTVSFGGQGVVQFNQGDALITGNGSHSYRYIQQQYKGSWEPAVSRKENYFIMKTRLFGNRHAFTLIELLIVVAIIAILAAIAVPNFMEAQTRAKVSRVKADMRSLTTGLEAYYVDANKYPPAAKRKDIPPVPTTGYPLSWRLVVLTTPVSYITTIPSDPFAGKLAGVLVDAPDYWDFSSVIYEDTGSDTGNEADSAWAYYSELGAQWRMISGGPDKKVDLLKGDIPITMSYGGKEYVNNIPGTTASKENNGAITLPTIYDATNGTMSKGDIVSLQGGKDPFSFCKVSN
jgi:prepilin-type N-terminal cleavage/methylation domain-containing protein